MIQPAEYLAQLREKTLDHLSLKGRGATFSPTTHELHVGRTFALSYDKLDAADTIDALALALLGRTAQFAPGEPIPRDLLLLTVGAPEGAEGQFLVEDALFRLAELGLLEIQAEGALILHRLLQAFVLEAESDAGAQKAVEEALLEEAIRTNNAGIPGPLLVWQPHLRAITNTALLRDDVRASGLCNTLGYHLEMIGEYAGARPYFDQALAICRKVLGEEHPDTASSLNNMGFLLYSMSDLEGARPYYEQALAICRKVLGEEHPDTASSLNNMGALLDSMGDLEGARPYYEQALAIRKRVLGEKHPDTASSLNNMGGLLNSMGDLEGARPYYEQALAIFKKVLGEKHPNTVICLNNMGLLLKEMGEL